MGVGETQQSNTNGRLSAFPPVKPRDILVEPENRRWRIVTVSSTERLRATLRQEISLHEITPGDVEFDIHINIDDLASLKPSPERNFTNPQCLGALSGARLSGVF